MKRLFRGLLILGTIGGSLIGCSDVVDDASTSDVAAATGGVVGAGVGAIIGSQTGDALGGTAIGAVAGAGTGYAVGNMLEQKEEAIERQNAAILRQEEQLRAQQAELNELRAVSGDQVQFKDSADTRARMVAPVNEFAPRAMNAPTTTNTQPAGSYGKYSDGQGYYSPPANNGAGAPIVSRELVDPSTLTIPNSASSQGQNYAMNNQNIEVHSIEPTTIHAQPIAPEPIEPSGQVVAKMPDFTQPSVPTAPAVDTYAAPEPVGNDIGSAEIQKVELSPEPVIEEAPPAFDPPEPTIEAVPEEPMQVAAVNEPNMQVPLSGECKRAQREAKKGEESEATADKLFYYRRALRLCPDEPMWHVKLGGVYASLGRQDDAKFEYQEALRISPDFPGAMAGLQQLGDGTY